MDSLARLIPCFLVVVVSGAAVAAAPTQQIIEYERPVIVAILNKCFLANALGDGNGGDHQPSNIWRDNDAARLVCVI